MKKIKLNKLNTLFLLIIILQLFCIFFVAKDKAIGHIDEFFSYGLSNSTTTHFLNVDSEYLNNQHPADYFKSYLEVDSGESFSLTPVINNQANDVHPPLYYILLHLICSVFPNSFSVWYGLTINIVSFIAVMFLLFLLSRQLFTTTNYISLLPCIVYGFSTGCLGANMYLRMYMLLTAFFMAFICIHKNFWKEEEKLSHYILLFLCTLTGSLTHYYFLIFAFFISGYYCLLKLFKRQFKKLFQYAIVMVAALGTAVVVFPSILDHLFVGYRGIEAVDKLFTKSNTLSQYKSYLKIMATDLFGGFFLVFLLLAIILMLTLIIKKDVHSKVIKTTLGSHIHILLSAILAASCYLLITGKIAPGAFDRYIYPIYPVLCLLVCWALLSFARGKRTSHLITAMLCITTLFGLFYGIANHNISYVYPEQNQLYDKLRNHYADTEAIYLTYGGWQVHASLLCLTYHPTTYMEELENKDHLDKIFNRADGNRMVIYISNEYQYDSALEYIKNNYSVGEMNYLGETPHAAIYVAEPIPKS